MGKVWYKNYGSDIPHNIDPDQYASIPDMLEECFTKYANSPCYMNYGESFTFRQVDRLSQTFAGFLQTRCQLEKGDRIAIIMPNCLQYPIALLGILKAGMVNVNISPLYKAKEVQEALQTTGAKCIVVLTPFAHVVEKALPHTQVKHVIVTDLGDLFCFPKRMFFNFVLRYIKKVIPPWNIKGAISFRESMLPIYHQQFKKPSLSGNDLAYLQLTDGRETGIPHCVMLTHRNFIANGLQLSAWFSPILQYIPKTIVFAALPFFKVAALSAYTLTFTRHEGIINLITNPYDVSLLMKEMKLHPPTIMSGIKTLFNKLLSEQTFHDLNLSSIKLTLSGGMAIPQIVADRWQSVTQTPIIQSYVLTEGSPIIAANLLSSKVFTGSVGLPLPSTDIKICDEQGQELPFNERGEVWVKGPQIMKGYWNQPEKTKEVLTSEGWFKTGDIATMDQDGYIYLIDRKEDLIKTYKGIIYPTEVENFIVDMGNIQDAIIVKGQSKDKKPIVKAYIVKNDPSLSEEAILSHCRRYLEDYQVPDEIEFRHDLPRSAIGYILRHQLKIEANLNG